MKPEEKPEIPPLLRCTCEPGKRLGVWVSAKSVLREPPEGECATCRLPIFWDGTKWMPVERAETPVEQLQIVSEGGDSAHGLKADRSEICAFLEELYQKAEDCSKTAQSATLRADRSWNSGAAMAYYFAWLKLKHITKK